MLSNLGKQTVERKVRWHLFDARNQITGRLASQIAPLLMGKHKPTYQPGILCGDYVVVINAKKIKFSGNKEKQKIYYRHTGYPGGLKETPAWMMREKRPEFLLTHAVKLMLPDTFIRREQMKRLLVFPGEVHKHVAQLGPVPELQEAKERSIWASLEGKFEELVFVPERGFVPVSQLSAAEKAAHFPQEVQLPYDAHLPNPKNNFNKTNAGNPIRGYKA